jgi:very-short-patch-repair endonuclease
MVRVCFEHIFNRPFLVGRPTWLGRQHLDGFCDEMKLAFEYDGEQHRRVVSKFKMNDEKLALNKRRDQRKNKLCSEHDVALVRVKEIAVLSDESVWSAVVKAIRANPYAWELCKNLDIKISHKVAPNLRAAMFRTGCDGTGQLLIIGIGKPIHMRATPGLVASPS